MEDKDIQGLSRQEVSVRQRTGGFNVLETVETKHLAQLLWELVTEPMILLLFAAASIYFFVGDKRESIMLLVSILAIVGISLYQERRSEKSLEALRNLSSPLAVVVRDGQQYRIPGREVVRGDIVVLSEGDRVPADAILIQAANLSVDESLLTGESSPVEKHTREVNDYRSNSVFAGTLVVKGHGIAEVTVIGSDTEMGKIGKSLNSIVVEKTLLQKEVAKMVSVIATLGLSLCVLLTIIYVVSRGDLVGGFLSGLTLAISIIPEEFPVVLTIFMTMGAWRLAQSNVLARRAATIETLGSATVLCVDKTGTLTENKMKVIETTGVAKEVIRFGILASQKKPFDPMEEAFVAQGRELLGPLGAIYDGYSLVREYPVESDSLSVAHVWQKTDQNTCVVALKGAPETVFDLCHMGDAARGKEEIKVLAMATKGLRVIAVAKGDIPLDSLPTDRHDIEYQFMGLVGLADPVRPGVKKAIAECALAGIRVIMITGDYPETALNIAQEVGLVSPGGAVLGSVIAEMGEKERWATLATTNVFSRVTPQQKLLIVDGLKHMGEVVAMTGDGVNDAPALKSAFIGIAMGKRGTDVAREAASIVLLDDDFKSIVNGVRLGRRIYSNLQKAMSYIFSVHVPIVALSLIPVIMKWPIMMLPAHIVFLELVIDPTCTLVFESIKEDPEVMRMKPRKLRESLFSARMVVRSLTQGLLIAVVTVGLYGFLIGNGTGHATASTMTFVTLLAANICLVLVDIGRGNLSFANLFGRHNRTLLTVLTLTTAALALVVYAPYFSSLFGFTALKPLEMVVSLLIGTAATIWLIPVSILIKRQKG